MNQIFFEMQIFLDLKFVISSYKKIKKLWDFFIRKKYLSMNILLKDCISILNTLL